MIANRIELLFGALRNPLSSARERYFWPSQGVEPVAFSASGCGSKKYQSKMKVSMPWAAAASIFRAC